MENETMEEQYKCQSYYDDNNILQDCTCGKCGNETMRNEVNKVLNQLYIIDDLGNTVPGDGVDYFGDEIMKIVEEHAARQKEEMIEKITKLKIPIRMVSNNEAFDNYSAGREDAIDEAIESLKEGTE